MSTSPRRGGALQAVRLGDIPLNLRYRAARSVARASGPVSDDVAPADRLFARLLSDQRAGGDATTEATLRRVAERPSERVYWISRAAYERVMLPKNRRTP